MTTVLDIKTLRWFEEFVCARLPAYYGRMLRGVFADYRDLRERFGAIEVRK